MNGEECETMERVNEKLVYMWGYLPGALPQRTPLLTPVLVRAPAYGYNWKDVSGGGCGFAMAISGANLFSCYFSLHLLILNVFPFN